MDGFDSYDEDRIVSMDEQHSDDWQYSLRPRKFGEYIGQEKAKGNLRVYLRAAQQRDERAAVVHLRRAARSQQRVERVGRGDARVLEALDLAAHRVVFAHDLLQRFIADKAKLMPDGRKALVGVVLPQQQPVLRAGGHHAVRLLGALGHQIVNQNTDITFGTIQNQRISMQNRHSCINTGDQSLGCSLFISTASVELSATEQTIDILKLQRRIQLFCIDTIIFDGIGISYNFTMFQSRNRTIHI